MFGAKEYFYGISGAAALIFQPNKFALITAALISATVVFARISEDLCAPLLLTTFDEEDFILRALKSEICGYILKNSPAERIINAVRTVNSGGTVFQEDILKYVRDKINPSKGGEIFSELTPRETEIVRLIAEGLSNQQIAERLFLSNGTVRNHISTILEKTGLEHRTQIAVMWLRSKQKESGSA